MANHPLVIVSAELHAAYVAFRESLPDLLSNVQEVPRTPERDAAARRVTAALERLNAARADTSWRPAAEAAAATLAAASAQTVTHKSVRRDADGHITDVIERQIPADAIR